VDGRDKPGHDAVFPHEPPMSLQVYLAFVAA